MGEIIEDQLRNAHEVARAVDSAASALRAVTDCSLRERQRLEAAILLRAWLRKTKAPPEGFGLLRDVIEAFLNLDDLPHVARQLEAALQALAPALSDSEVWQQVVQLLQSSAWAPLRGIGAGHQHLGRASRAATALQRLVCAALAGHQDSDGQDASCFDTLRSVCDTCVPDVLIAVSLACRCSDWQQLLELAATASKLHAKVLVFLLDEDPSFESDNSPPSSFTDERWCELFEGAVAGGFVAPFSSSADEPSAAAAVAAARAEKWALRALCGWADIGSESEGIADDAPAPVTQGVKLFFLSARCARAVATAGLRSPSSVARLQSLRYSRRCLEAGGEVAAAGLGDPERLLAALCRALALSGEEWGDWLEANSDNGAAVVRAAVRREDAMVAALATTSIGAEVDACEDGARLPGSESEPILALAAFIRRWPEVAAAALRALGHVLSADSAKAQAAAAAVAGWTGIEESAWAGSPPPPESERAVLLAARLAWAVPRLGAACPALQLPAISEMALQWAVLEAGRGQASPPVLHTALRLLAGLAEQFLASERLVAAAHSGIGPPPPPVAAGLAALRAAGARLGDASLPVRHAAVGACAAWLHALGRMGALSSDAGRHVSSLETLSVTVLEVALQCGEDLGDDGLV
ncbi:unnamed protein product, partial [Polarella glacialis]